MYELNSDSKLLPPPAWYPGRLPRFYASPQGGLYLRPVNAVKGYTDNDVLDCLLYLQTIIGYNRPDHQNAVNVAVTDGNGKDLARAGITENFVNSYGADGSLDFMQGFHNGTGTTVNGTLYTQLQQRYILNEAATRPWLKYMNAMGGKAPAVNQRGIDLMTIPSATDIEISRPGWYTNYLPSLFKSAGYPFQYPAGHLDTKPKIRNYVATADDVAKLMVYAQPVILVGPTPYFINWYINDVVNGAEANYFKVSLTVSNQGHNDAQEQLYGITGDMMTYPNLDADPYASGFTKALQAVVSTVFSFFTAKIPGGAALTTAANTVAKMGGAGISGTDNPEGTFSAAVFQAADKLSKGLVAADKTRNILLLGLAGLAALWIAQEEGYI